MRKLSNFKAHWVSGFTLVELMVVVLVITILTVIAVPSYLSQVRKSRRSEVKSILTDLGAREERYMATNGLYSSAITDLGFSVAWGQPVGSGYYTIATPTITAAASGSVTVAATPATWSFTASTTGAQTQDTECATFMITSQGQRTSANSAGAATTDCW